MAAETKEKKEVWGLAPLRQPVTPALAQYLNVEHAEIATELEAIAKEDSGLKEFIAKVPKHPLPKMDEYTRL
jgi:hypothetical protein